jgi:hypothetical protein
VAPPIRSGASLAAAMKVGMPVQDVRVAEMARCLGAGASMMAKVALETRGAA